MINKANWNIIVDGSLRTSTPDYIGQREYDYNEVISDYEPIGTSLNKIDNFIHQEFYAENLVYDAYQDFTKVSSQLQYQITQDLDATNPVAISNYSKILNDLNYISITDSSGNPIYKNGTILKIDSNIVNVTAHSNGLITLSYEPKTDFRINYKISYTKKDVPEGKIINAGRYSNVVNSHDNLDDRDSNDSHPISAITNLQTNLDSKQSLLISGTNIKTLEGQSLLGSGNIDLSKSDVGLGNVDNTSDITKNVLSATKLSTARTIGILTGDITSEGSTFDGSANNTNSTTISSNVVTNTKLSDMPTMTIKGNNTGSTADPIDLTVAQTQNMLSDATHRFVTDAQIAQWNTGGTGVEPVYGVNFVDNGSGFTATRYGLNVGKNYNYSISGNNISINSDLDNAVVFKDIRRCICNNENVPVAFYGDANYDDTLTLYGYAPHTHYVGVYVPKFYYRYKVVTEPIYTLDLAISNTSFTGAIVHEWFTNIDRDGVVTESDYKIVSAFEGVAVNKNTGAYLFTDRTDATTRVSGDFMFGTLKDYANYMLTSVNKANKQAPATNTTLSNFRTMAQNRSLTNTSKRVTSQLTFWAMHAINMLFMVEFASTNWQSVLGAGVTNLTSGTSNEAVSTGYTSELGNKSGYVKGIVRGTLGTTQVTSYRGVENFFGNEWKFLEGIKKSTTTLKLGSYDVTKTNDYSVYENNDFYNEKTSNVNTTSEYAKFRNIYLVSYISKSGTNYYNDYQYYTSAGQIALLGGNWSDTSIAGGFSLGLSNDFSLVIRSVGGRLVS